MKGMIQRNGKKAKKPPFGKPAAAAPPAFGKKAPAPPFGAAPPAGGMAQPFGGAAPAPPFGRKKKKAAGFGG